MLKLITAREEIKYTLQGRNNAKLQQRRAHTAENAVATQKSRNAIVLILVIKCVFKHGIQTLLPVNVAFKGNVYL